MQVIINHDGIKYVHDKLKAAREMAGALVVRCHIVGQFYLDQFDTCFEDNQDNHALLRQGLLHPVKASLERWKSKPELIYAELAPQCHWLVRVESNEASSCWLSNSEPQQTIHHQDAVVQGLYHFFTRALMGVLPKLFMNGEKIADFEKFWQTALSATSFQQASLSLDVCQLDYLMDMLDALEEIEKSLKEMPFDVLDSQDIKGIARQHRGQLINSIVAYRNYLRKARVESERCRKETTGLSGVIRLLSGSTSARLPSSGDVVFKKIPDIDFRVDLTGRMLSSGTVFSGTFNWG